MQVQNEINQDQREEFFVFKEKFVKRQIVGVLLGTVGLVLVNM